MKQENKTKVAVAIVGGVVLGGIAGGIAGSQLFPQEVEVEKIVTETVEVPVEVPVEKIVNQTVVEEVEVEKIVEVDNGNLAVICESLEDRDIVDDAKNCFAEVTAEDNALRLAVEEIKANLAEELEDEDIIEDEDEFDIKVIYDNYDDVNVKVSDYEDEEYKFVIEVKVEDEDTNDVFKVDVTVEVDEGHADIVKVVKQ